MSQGEISFVNFAGRFICVASTRLMNSRADFYFWVKLTFSLEKCNVPKWTQNRNVNITIDIEGIKCVEKILTLLSWQVHFAGKFYQVLKEESMLILIKISRRFKWKVILPNSFNEASITLVPMCSKNTMKRKLQATCTDEHGKKHLKILANRMKQSTDRIMI